MQTLLCSDNEEERREGITRIVQGRGEGDPGVQVGSSAVRPRKTPEINWDATKLSELTFWEGSV